MSKSSKPTKNYLQKTIKAYSLPLDNETFKQLNSLMIRYGRCQSMFFNQYCGIHNMLKVQDFRKVRNDIKDQGLDKMFIQRYQFLNKHWIYSLSETCANVKSMWSNLQNQINTCIRDNENLSDDEQHYLRFVMSFPVLWHGILCYRKNAYLDLKQKYQAKYLQVVNSINSDRFHYLHNYLRRLTRRYKPKPRRNNNHNRSMTYDENMYLFKNRQFRFSSAVNRKRFIVTLTSDWHYSLHGNLRIILDRDKKRIEIHKLIQSHQKSMDLTNSLGIDKGLATLISCSNGNEYGHQFSKLNTNYAEVLTKKNSHRNQMRSKYGQIDSINYRKFRNRHKAHLQAKVNQIIRQMIITEKPSVIVKEDLSFTKESLPKDKNKHMAKVHRKLNQWVKGYLNQRLEYYCHKYQIPFIDINPAYTSQYCPICGHHFTKRYGTHNELVDCKYCGTMNANIAAAKNILSRKDDLEINLYTPYKKVKQILDARI